MQPGRDALRPEVDGGADSLRGPALNEERLVIPPSPAIELINGAVSTVVPELQATPSSSPPDPLLAFLEQCAAEERLPSEAHGAGTLITEGQPLTECYLILRGAPVHVKKTVNHPDGPVKLRYSEMAKRVRPWISQVPYNSYESRTTSYGG